MLVDGHEKSIILSNQPSDP